MNQDIQEKKIRPSIKAMAEGGISLKSIVASHGYIVTPDERDYLEEYESRSK
jgi:hypothetical protein